MVRSRINPGASSRLWGRQLKRPDGRKCDCVVCWGGGRRVAIKDYFIGQKNCSQSDEVLVGIELPFTDEVLILCDTTSFSLQCIHLSLWRLNAIKLQRVRATRFTVLTILCQSTATGSVRHWTVQPKMNWPGPESKIGPVQTLLRMQLIHL